MPLTIDQGADTLRQLRRAIAARIVGQDAAIDDALIAFLARGHLLIEGVPGTAKTLLVRTLAAALGVRFTRVQFTPDLPICYLAMKSIGRRQKHSRRCWKR